VAKVTVQTYDAYNNMKRTTTISCLGGKGYCPNITMGAGGCAIFDNKWSSMVNDNPYPIRYTLRSIDTLLTKEYFPDDGDIERKHLLRGSKMHSISSFQRSTVARSLVVFLPCLRSIG